MSLELYVGKFNASEERGKRTETDLVYKMRGSR